MAKPRKAQAPPPDRRARREAQRAERRSERRSAPGARGFSPLVLVTAAAVVLGLAIVGFVALQGRPAVTVVRLNVSLTERLITSPIGMVL